MWVFSLVKIEFHANNQIKKRRHVFQRTYRCCAPPWSYSCFRCVFCRSYLSLNLIVGFQVKRAFTLPPDWKANVPYTLDSVARYSYQKPNPQEELQVPITRYGSNRKKAVAATGTSKTPASKYNNLFSLSVPRSSVCLFWYFLVPTASSRFYHIKGRTTYDRHYNDNAENVINQVRDVGYKLEQEALQKYLEKVEGQGQFHSRATVWARHLPALF